MVFNITTDEYKQKLMNAPEGMILKEYVNWIDQKNAPEFKKVFDEVYQIRIKDAEHQSLFNN